MSVNRKTFQEKALATLINNAYDFLETALENLTEDTKRSVIDFYTAVELFLKAPLLNEHWSLIIAKDPNFQKFKNGDFNSIGFHESIKRLNDVLEVSVSQETQNAFNKVRKHRNQYVHLFINEDEGKLANIALEQYQAWAHLLNLINNQFIEIFRKHSDKNNKIEASLSRNLHFWREHAKLKLPTLKDMLDQKKQAGATIGLCLYCQTHSTVIEEISSDTFDSKCLICHHYKQLIQLSCPHCTKTTMLTDGYSSCHSCGHTFSPEELYVVLDTYSGRPKDSFSDGLPASCGFCEGYEAVCEFHDSFLCTNCFETTESLSTCEYCQTSLNYTPEDSYATGCGFCNGAVSRS